jgi:hypothetical protein
MLCKISDRNGNSIVFKYDKCVKDGVSYINNVEYTMNEKAGVNTAYKIQFIYEPKANASMSYVYGNAVSCKKILTNVKIVNNYTGKIIYNYSLEYHKPDFYGRNYFIYYRLKSVGLDIGEDKINPTKIIWNSEKHYSGHSGDFKMYQLDKSTFSNVPFIGDFNGDGFSDVLLPTNPVLLISLSMSNVSYGKWVKWTWNMQLLMLAVSLSVLFLGVQIGF